MADNEYRTKSEVPVVEQSPVKQITPSTPVDTETDKVETSGSPASVEYFEYEGWGEILLDERLDVFGVKDKIIYIEKFISDQIKSQKLINDKNTINAILREVEKSVKLSRYHDKNERIKTVYDVFKMMEKSSRSKTRIKNLIMKANEEAEKINKLQVKSGLL